MLKLTLILICAAQVFGQNRLTVTIPQGSLTGIEISSTLSRSSYWSFRGIPYAEPPVGNLRFRNPVPHRGWSGTLDATDYRAACPTRLFLGVITPTIDENCLFLNVNTMSTTGNRPVMVWIHGGGFLIGDGTSNIFGPDLFVNDGGVVVVSINYRLGVFGFFSTNDPAAQGNWAMKDVVEALRWVRNNIQHFGGNPNSITVFGQSAGAVAVHYLLLSQQASGLFHRVILQSGSATIPWAFQPNPAAEATRLGQRLGLSWTSNQDLVNQLRNLPWRTVLQQQNEIEAFNANQFSDSFIPNAWVPNVEPANSPEQRFLTDTPVNIMIRGNVLRVPMIIGYTSDESLYVIPETIGDRNYFDRFASNPINFVPNSFNLNPATQSAQINEVANAFRNFYFNGQNPTSAIRYNFTQYYSDHVFAYPLDRLAQYHSRHQTQPIYYYIFSFDGALNMVKIFSALRSYPGAMHGDDLFYMYDINTIPTTPILPSNHANVIRRRMVQMWTNFATFGDPTPITDALIRTRWQPYNRNTQNYLDIGDESVNRNLPQNGRLQKWHNFQNRFNPSFP